MLTLSFVELKKSTPSQTTLEPWEIDLGKFQTISDFADRYEREGGGRLDLLIMNAAINTIYHSADESGWDQSYVIFFPKVTQHDMNIECNNTGFK